MTYYTTAREPLQIDTVLFDLDGTLVDTLSDIEEVVNRALGEHRLPALTRSEVSERVGEGGTALVEASMRKSRRDHDPALVARVYQAYLAGYARQPAARARLYPGADALLRRLRTAGVRVALCTNKSRHVTAPLLAAVGLDTCFDAVVTGDGPERRKPAPDPLLSALRLVGGSSALMVGDSVYDLRAAQAAGMPVAWVSFGYGTHHGAAPPDLELDGLDDLETAARAAGIHVRAA
ncbi:HAD-IA family hydrolase [Streptomyces sp. NPDC021622]|uniref:HAD family hydrolase n=1 Tax=Streptomyces sp. NPDC021622 TaxID=3155013 RepID=UPI0033D905DA